MEEALRAPKRRFEAGKFRWEPSGSVISNFILPWTVTAISATLTPLQRLLFLVARGRLPPIQEPPPGRLRTVCYNEPCAMCAGA